MKVSVVIPTYNRANLLPGLLKKISEQSLSGDDYEVLIVDNASKDNTREVVDNFIRIHPNFRYFLESTPGSSCCRNRGIREAKGSIIAFLDDDTLPDFNWLEEHIKAYDSNPKVVSIGGRIELLLPKVAIPVALKPYKILLGYFFPSRNAFLLQWPDFPVECNFSVRREIGAEIGWFSEKFCRKGNNLFSNDGKQFFYEIMTRRHLPVLYNPKALIFHIVPPERLTKKFILKRMHAQGVSDAIFERFFIGPDNLCYWVGNKLFGKKLRDRVTVFAAGRKERKNPFFHLCFKMSYFLGYYRGFFTRNL